LTRKESLIYRCSLSQELGGNSFIINQRNTV